MAQEFSSVYKEHVWSVFGFLAYRAGTREEAEDLTQLTFERALRAWPRFDPTRASAKTWLLTIARNALIDEHRKSRATEGTLDEVDQDPVLATPGADQALGGVRPELAAALGRLGQRDREVLALRYGADLESAEIARLLETTVANVHQIASRALRKLRAELEARQAV